MQQFAPEPAPSTVLSFLAAMHVYIYIYICFFPSFFIPRGILCRRVAGFEFALVQRPVGPRPVKKGGRAEGR